MYEFTENQKKFLEALEKNFGIVTDSAKECGLRRETHYGWLKTCPEYKEAVDELYQVEADFVRRNLMKNIAAGDQAAMNTWIKYKGRRAGWVDKQDMDVNVTSNVIKFTFGNNLETKTEENA